jgi:hypothetical protein
MRCYEADKGGGTGNDTPPPNPYEGIDMDLIDDKSKAILDKVAADLANARTESSKFQSMADKAGQLLQQQQTQQRQQQQVTPPKPLTYRETLVEEYKKAGVPDNIALLQADVISKATEAHLDQKLQQLQNQFMPVAHQTALHSVQSALNEAAMSSPFMQQPAVYAKVQEAAMAMLENGSVPDAATLLNIGKMAAFDIQLEGGQQMQQPTPIVPTTFRFGAQPPLGGNGFGPTVKPPAPVDPAITAAMAVTAGIWRKQFNLTPAKK